MRTIVFSDVHGEPSIIDAIIEHSRFDPHADRLVFAGDAVDIGRDPWGCLELLDEVGAECLVGNHEYAAFIDYRIDDVPLTPSVLGRIEENLTSGRWGLAAEADGALITHAGISSEFIADFTAHAGGDVARFAAALNVQFRRAVALRGMAGGGVIEMGGPLWWRPDTGEMPLLGVTQIAGHTPREIVRSEGGVGCLAASGLHLVDPWVRGWGRRGFGLPVPVRYAVIGDGRVRVVDAG